MQSSKLKFVLICVIVGLVVVAIAWALYVHIFAPFSNSFLADHGIEVVRSGDALESSYSALSHKVLRTTYFISVIGTIFTLVLAYRRSVAVVFVGLLVAILLFYQVADYLQYRWLLEIYSVVVFGV